MLFSSTKFLGGKNIQNVTTLTFKRSAGSGLGEFFDRVDIVDPKGYTKLGTGSNFRRSDVIAGITFGGSVPVELNPATYSIRVTGAQLISSYSPFNATLDGDIEIRIARMENMFTDNHTEDETLASIRLTDTDNQELDGTKKWLFEDYDIASSGTHGGLGNSTNQTSFPFTLIKKMPITFLHSTRIQEGPQTDDASMSIFAHFDVPTSGSPISAQLTLELVEGFDFD